MTATPDAALPDAIFFDMDGTILDWQTGMEESWLAACEAHCDGSFEPAQLHELIRARRTWFWSDPARAYAGRMDLDGASREIVRAAFIDSRRNQVELAHRIADDYRARRTAAIAPYPGAFDVLDTVRGRGIRMALLTNGEARNQRRSVEQHGLSRYFDCIVIEGEFGVGKPDERVFRHALAATGSDPAGAWMVGDSLEADIAPAVALGLHAVWVNEDGVEAPEHVRPHRIVRSIAELL